MDSISHTILHKSTFHDIGKRPHDEDRIKVIAPFAKQNNLCLIVVVDGHGGSKCADFVIDRFPQALEASIMNCKQEGISVYTTFMSHALSICVQEWDDKCFGKEIAKIKNKQTRQQFFEKRDINRWKEEELESGCTLCSVLCDLVTRQMYILNIGDSRAAWCCDEKLIAHTVDHSVKNQMDPIKDFDFEYGDGYLEDDLSMCRSIGDNTEKLFRIVSRKPDLLTVQMGLVSTRLVVATDGFFDWVTCHEALYEDFKDASELAHQISTFDDNISVVYLKLGPGLKVLGETDDNHDSYVPKCASNNNRRSKSPKPKKVTETTPQKRETKHQVKQTKNQDIVIHTSRTPKSEKIKKSIKRNPIVKMTKEQINAILGDQTFLNTGKDKNKDTDKNIDKNKNENKDKNKEKRKEQRSKKSEKQSGKKSSSKSSGKKSDKSSGKRSEKKLEKSRKKKNNSKDKSFESLLKSLK